MRAVGASVLNPVRFRTFSYARLAATGTVGLVLVMVALPIFVLVFTSFRLTEDKLPFEDTIFTLQNYSGLLSAGKTYTVLLNTLWYALGAVGAGFTLAMVFSWLFERTNMPFRSIMIVLLLAPMAIPSIVKTMGWILLLNPMNGTFNVLLREWTGAAGPGPINIYSLTGMMLVSGIGMVPSIYVLVSHVFARFDVRLEESARTSGATARTTFRRITVPLLRPAMLTGAIFYFVNTLDNFEGPALLGMPRDIFVFSTYIYRSLRSVSALPNYGLTSAFAMVLLGVAAVLVIFYARSVRHAERFAVVTGKGYKPSLINLGRWRWLALVLVVLYFSISALLPLAMVIWASLSPGFSVPSLSGLAELTAARYVKLAHSEIFHKALTNTLLVTTTTATATTLLSAVVAWIAVRQRSIWGKLADWLPFINLANPSIILASALLFFFVGIPLPIYGSNWIIIIGLIMAYLPYGTRIMGPAYLQIHKELEEAARISGASTIQTMIRIVLPLVRTAVWRGWLWMFIHGTTATTIPVVLGGIDNQTVTTLLFITLLEEGDLEMASTMAVPLVVICSLLTLFVARQTLLLRNDNN
jgi:iron(III) transport system permease protein